MNINGKRIIKGSDDYNRLANQIADMNFEIKLFLNKFDEFRKECKLVDKNLCNSLDKLVENVEDFLEEDLVDLESKDKTKCFVDLAKEGMLRVYVCTYCNIEIGVKWRDIKDHLRMPNHKKMFYKNAFKDHVDKLDQQFKTQSSSSLLLQPPQPIPSSGVNSIKKEQQNHNNQQQNSQPKTKEKLRNSEERRLQRKAENMKRNNLPKKTKSLFESDLNKLLNEAVLEGNKMKQIPAYENIETSLKKLIKPLFPSSDIKIRFFGSRINGLGSKHSDLDVFLDIDDAFNKYNESDKVIQNKLTLVQKALKEDKNWGNIVAVKTARVPIIKVLNKENHLDCDIGFSNGLGFCNTQLMKYLFELQPICHKTCLFIKKWITTTALIDQFSTYTFILMTIFFLQKKKILPPIQTLQENIPNPAEIGPWQYNFASKTLKDLGIEKFPDDTLSCENLVCELFEFYAKYKFDQLVISPYLGRSVNKSSLNSAKQEFPRYYYHFLRDTQNGFQVDRAMCVQDPIEQNHNVAKGISEKLVNLLVQYFDVSGTVMRSRLQQNS